jgi:prophage regulatory protein
MSIPRYPPDPCRMLRAKDVAKLLSIHEMTVWTMARDGRLPKPIKIGPGTTCWRYRDIERWLDELSEREAG